MLDSPKPVTPDISEPNRAQARAVRNPLHPVAWKRLLVLLVGLLAIGTAGLTAWKAILAPLSVEVSRAESDVPVQVFGLGTVEARIASRVGFKVSGVLVDLAADVGDRVAKGALLAQLDDREQQAHVARARAGIAQAEANLQRALASVEKGQANYANARGVNQRRQSLAQSNNASIEAAQAAQTGQQIALADLNLANSEVMVARAALGDARALQQQEEVILDFHKLAAPYDSRVITRQKELGSALGAGEQVFTLIDPESVWVLAYVDESKAGEIAVGKPAEMVLRSLPGKRFTGRVARIQPESDRVNEERRVEIAFDRLPDTPYLGEQAEIFVTTARLEHALLVPETAIEGLANGRGSIWVVEDGRLGQREVTLGHRLLDGRYEIAGGVPDGALAVTQLRSGLRIGRATKLADSVR